MSNVSTYSATAANNNSASPNGAPEGMAPSGVNDTIREIMSGIAKWYAGLKGALVTTGSLNTYALSTGSSHASLAAIGLVVFRANHTNTGAATLAVDGLTAKALRHRGNALAANALIQDDMYAFVYNPTDDAYDMVGSPATFNALIAATLTAAGLAYPSADGTSGQAIVTNGAGVLSFASTTNAITETQRTSNTILAAGDRGKLFNVTSGTFSQTLTAAATLGAGWYCYYQNTGSGVVTLDPDGSETINGATTLVVRKGATLLILCDGSNFTAIVLAWSAGSHQVVVHTGNGFGSTNTMIRRFTTTQESTGTAITYADSAGNGGSFTINEDGIYSIRYLDESSSGTMYAGISLNSAELTTAIQSITAANRLAHVTGPQGITGNSAAVWCGRLVAGDVVRAHADAGTTYTSAAAKNVFQITKIGN